MADDPKKPPAPARGGASSVDRFLDQARSVPAPHERPSRGRLVFALDATMSRQPTWDLAQSAAGQDVRGGGRARRPRRAARLFPRLQRMPRLALRRRRRGTCEADERDRVRGGHTQIGKVLRHVRDETKRARRSARSSMSAMPWKRRPTTSRRRRRRTRPARRQGLLLPRGPDPTARRAFREIARLTGGAYATFDAGTAGAAREPLGGGRRLRGGRPRGAGETGPRRRRGARLSSRRCADDRQGLGYRTDPSGRSQASRRTAL